MDKRKIIKIFFVIVGLFIAMAIAEISIRSIGTTIQEFSNKKETEKQQQELYNSEPSVEKRQIEKFVDDVYSALEEQKYEVVYNLLNPKYRDCVFENELENFKSFVQEKLFLGGQHNIAEITKWSGRYIVIVRVNEGENYKTQTCAVEVIDENTYHIMFDGITKLQKTSDTIMANNNIMYELKYYYETPNVGVLALEVTNTSDKDTSIEMSNIFFETSGGQKYKGTASGNFNIKAKQKTKIIITYNKTNYSLNNLSFVEIQNGKTTDVNIRLNEIFGVDTE